MIKHYASALDPLNDETYEAVQLTSENQQEVAQWCHGQTVVEHDAEDYDITYSAINVETFQGTVRASEGDYIYKGASGHFYVRRPGIFARSFKEVEKTDGLQ